MFDRIKEIIEDCIGKPRRDDGRWYEYCCPFCASELGVENDGKYNLALNYGEDLKTKPFFHCWKCGKSGKLSKLIKEFGSNEHLYSYREEIKNIHQTLLYNFDNNECSDFFVLDEALELPKDFRPIRTNDKYAKEAVEYLKSRNITEPFFEHFNLGYVPYWSEDRNMRSRIIIPSYDKFGDLNYYVARDYTGKRKYRKYNNPQIEKTLFVFNEAKINWYEDVTIVEGAFDHMVIPNSIPLLGKSLKPNYATYDSIVNNAKLNVNILLDDDAVTDAEKLYKMLNSTQLKNRVRIIYCPKGYDAADIYRNYGKNGVFQLMKSATKIEDFNFSINEI